MTTSDFHQESDIYDKVYRINSRIEDVQLQKEFDLINNFWK